MKRSQAQETRGAKLHGGERNAVSGALPFRKNDVRTPTELVEYKRTDKKSITIKLADLEDVRTNAILSGRTALFGIEIGGRDYILAEAHVFEQYAGLEVTDDRD
jgi:hypothetical protein